MVHHVKSDVELQRHLSEAGNSLVVIDFYNKRCRHCREIAPEFHKLADQMTDIVFLEVEVKDSPYLAKQYEIDSTPTFLFMKDAQKVDLLEGANPELLRALIHRNSGN